VAVRAVPAAGEVVIGPVAIVARSGEGLTRVRQGATFHEFGVAPDGATASTLSVPDPPLQVTIIRRMTILPGPDPAIGMLDRGAPPGWAAA
jgi:hypothetical protein